MNRLFRIIEQGLLIICLLVWLVSAAAAHAKPVDKASLLFVVSAQSATLERRAQGFYLILTEIDPSVLWFTDRPYRKTGFIKTRHFIELWSQSQASVPPNIGLVHAGMELVSPKGRELTPQPVIVALSPPMTQGKTITFKVRGLTHNKIPLAKLSRLHLFINSSPCSISHLDATCF